MEGQSNAADNVTRSLVESETLEKAGCQRALHWHFPNSATEGPVADRVREMLDSPTAARRSALAVALGYEFDPRRLHFDEMAQRMVASEYFRLQGVERLVLSPVLYQSRPRWDVYAPRLRTLAIVNHLASESDVLGNLNHGNLRMVIWAPDLSDRERPDHWFTLRYEPLTPRETTGRNWFDETVRQGEQESLNRRTLTLELKNGERELPAVQDAVKAFRDQIREALESIAN